MYFLIFIFILVTHISLLHFGGIFLVKPENGTIHDLHTVVENLMRRASPRARNFGLRFNAHLLNRCHHNSNYNHNRNSSSNNNNTINSNNNELLALNHTTILPSWFLDHNPLVIPNLKWLRYKPNKYLLTP